MQAAPEDVAEVEFIEGASKLRYFPIMGPLSDIVLRSIGAFYLLVSFVGVRRLAMDRLLDNAIEAISGRKEQSAEARAGRLRWQIMFIILTMTALAGVLTIVMLDIAVFALVIVSVGSVINLVWVLPAYVDPHDPPQPEERRKSWIATAVFIIFTLWALAHWRNGGMTGIHEAHAGLLAAAGLLAVLFAAHAIRSLRMSTIGGTNSSSQSDWASSDDDTSGWAAIDAAEIASYRGTVFVLRPALSGNVFFRADNGEAVPYHLPVEELGEEERMRLAEWQDAFREAIDPDDPTHTKFKSSELRQYIAAQGEALLEHLRSRLGAQRVTLDMSLRTFVPRVQPQGLVVRARVYAWPLQYAEGDQEAINPFDLGISRGLEEEIGEWGSEYENACLDAEGGGQATAGPNWDVGHWANYNARGVAIAGRLARELAATGRSHVKVTYIKPEFAPE